MGLLRSVSHDETAPHFGHRRCTAAHCCRPRPKGRRPRGHVLRRACSRPIMAPTVLPIDQFADRKCHWRYASFSDGPGVLPATERWALCSERIPGPEEGWSAANRSTIMVPRIRRGDGAGMAAPDVFWSSISFMCSS